MKQAFKKIAKIFPVVSLSLIILWLFSYIFFLILYQNKIFPGVKVANSSVGGQHPAALNQNLKDELEKRISQPLDFSDDGQTFTLNLADFSPQINSGEAAQAAYLWGRSSDYLKDLSDQLQTIIFGKNFTLVLTFRQENLLRGQISQINQFIKEEPKNATVILGQDITITPSREGSELDEEKFFHQLTEYLSLTPSSPPVLLPTKTTQPSFTTQQAEAARTALEKVKLYPLKLNFQQQAWVVDQPTLFKLLSINNPKGASASASLLSSEQVGSFLQQISDKINQPVQDAKFTFDPNTKKVAEFQPAQLGQELDIDQTMALITQSLESSPSAITLPVKTLRPKIETADVNSFGIQSLLGRGISNFAGSITNRIYNIGLSSSRINGVLLAPGEIFSFNNTVGDISAATGYKQAYVIKSGRTVLDDGGGVCQVSTTLFRAVLNAGLPIVARTAHAYRVSYYEQGFSPGLDATVFAPSVDFKFKNDTPNYILIQTNLSGIALTIDLYGTDDGRIASLSKPVVTSQTPPPPELRQDDPTLPKGEVKQVDWPAWGANVSFNRTVKRGGETIISETFRSNYRPWQAVFLVGTKE